MSKFWGREEKSRLPVGLFVLGFFLRFSGVETSLAVFATAVAVPTARTLAFYFPDNRCGGDGDDDGGAHNDKNDLESAHKFTPSLLLFCYEER